MIFLKKSLQKQIQSKFCTNLVLVFSWHAVVHLNKQLDISSFFGGKKTLHTLYPSETMAVHMTSYKLTV